MSRPDSADAKAIEAQGKLRQIDCHSSEILRDTMLQADMRSDSVNSRASLFLFGIRRSGTARVSYSLAERPLVRRNTTP
ncbi:hypothetical protein VTI74DRAFT_6846 [Chaetomium olivicolor]